MEDCEVWKDIPGYEGLYQVSNLGRVKSLNYHRSGKERFLKPQRDSHGYFEVRLYIGKKNKLYKVHGLVCQAFIPNPDNLPQVNHINEIKTDNRAINLEWCTAKYNCNYGKRNDKIITTRNKRGVCGAEKPVAQIASNGLVVKIWPSIKEAGRNGFNNGHICRCCNGKLKTHAGYKWLFFLPPALPYSPSLEEANLNKEYK